MSRKQAAGRILYSPYRQAETAEYSERRKCRGRYPGTNIYGNISTSAEGFEPHQDQSSAQPDKAAVHLFWERRCGGDSLLYFYKGFSGDTGIVPDDGSDHAAVFLFGDVRKARLPGGEDTVPYGTAEIPRAGDQAVPLGEPLQEAGRTGKDQEGGAAA